MDITEINTLIIKTRTSMSDLINKWERFMVSRNCLLYTSDAADE